MAIKKYVQIPILDEYYAKLEIKKEKEILMNKITSLKEIIKNKKNSHIMFKEQHVQVNYSNIYYLLIFKYLTIVENTM